MVMDDDDDDNDTRYVPVAISNDADYIYFKCQQVTSRDYLQY